MLTSDQITELFFLVDEYCILFEKNINQNLIKVSLSTDKRSRNRSFGLSKSEVITLLIAFHQSDYRTLKHFYKDYVCVHLQKEFPSLVSYIVLVNVPASPSLIPLKLPFAKINVSASTGNLKTLPKEAILPPDGSLV